MRPASLAALLAAVAALPLLTARPAPAEGPAAPPGPVRQLVLAQSLYDSGVQAQDPLLLLTALRLARSADPRPATGWVQDGDGIPDPAPAPPEGLPRDPAAPEAVALAVMMAEGDPALADLAATVAAGLEGTTGRGHVSTATRHLPPGKADRWRMAFNGSLPAEVAVIADGAFGLTVAEEGGAVICDSPAPAAPTRAYCSFTPAENGFFTVTVTSADTGANEAGASYRLMTN